MGHESNLIFVLLRTFSKRNFRRCPFCYGQKIKNWRSKKLSAKMEQIAQTVTFRNDKHRRFFLEYLPKCRYADVYHAALVYCLGIDEDTRKNVNSIYNFKTGCVKVECLHEGNVKSKTYGNKYKVIFK